MFSASTLTKSRESSCVRLMRSVESPWLCMTTLDEKLATVSQTSLS